MRVSLAEGGFFLDYSTLGESVYACSNIRTVLRYA
jgi:hypothetical protein